MQQAESAEEPEANRTLFVKSREALQRLRAFLHARPDSEHEVSINRLWIYAVGVIYWFVASRYGPKYSDPLFDNAAPVFAGYLVAAILLCAHLIWKPEVSHVRRCIAIPLDLAFLSWGIYLGDDATALLYPIYLWIILGNGFRYGLYYLAAATVTGTICFGIVLFSTPFWHSHLGLGLGLSIGLIVIPAYSGTLIRKLSVARLVAEDASRAKSMFLASVSHELRTPLNAIVGLSDLLCNSSLDDEQSEMVRLIGRSGRSLSSLINSILDVSRMEIGKLPIKTEKLDLFCFLQDIRDMVSVQASAKGLRVCVHAAAGIPHNVIVNIGHLEEILVNLAGNAVKFTQEGFVLIHVALSSQPGRLRFMVRDTGIGIEPEARERIFERFSQADETIIDRYGGTGLGLSIAKQLVEGSGGSIGVESAVGVGSTFWFEIDVKEALDSDSADAQEISRKAKSVFLVSADKRVQSAFALVCGSALHCFDVASDAIAKMEAEAGNEDSLQVVVLDEQTIGPDFESTAHLLLNPQSGHRPSLVWLRDTEDFNFDAVTCSWFDTSVVRSASAPDIGAAIETAISLHTRQKASAVLANTASPLEILVAEDNRTNQLVIRKILERQGHCVTIADNGELALEALGRSTFDLVFMDVNMPVLNGIEAAKLARFIELDGPRVSIVALTADATAETRARCLEAGMDDCLTKPIDQAKLLAWLEHFQKSRFDTDRKASPISKQECASSPADACESTESSLALDYRALEDLESLGGKEFVDQIVSQFVEDATSVLKDLSEAVAKGDAYTFREQAHALRSCAANVGAKQVYDLCLTWRAIDATEIAKRGEDHMRQLEAEFSRARTALTARN